VCGGTFLADTQLREREALTREPRVLRGALWPLHLCGARRWCLEPRVRSEGLVPQGLNPSEPASSGVCAGGVFRKGRTRKGVPVRSKWFLQSALLLALLFASSGAWSRGPGAGHGGHAGVGHGFGHGFHGGGRGHHFFHHGVVFVGPVAPFGFDYPEPPLAPVIPMEPPGCDPEAGCAPAPPGVGGLLMSGPSLAEEPVASTEIDLTRAHWRHPDPGECPPDQMLLRLPAQRQWRCADPRLQPADTLRIAP
jgi:hypothetical protein